MSATQPPKEKVTLSGVSETALLTLNARAREARRQDSLIDDPMAVALVDSIDFDFAKFGPSRQGIALLRPCSTGLSEHPPVADRGGAG